MTNVYEPDDLKKVVGERRISASVTASPDLSSASFKRTSVIPRSHQQQTPQFSHFVVVAIDFGTTYSGYAYSFTHEPENIHIMRKWEGK